jgi:hypothetical protein
MASSLSALLTALDSYIKRYESLRRANILYRDISINNLIVNNDSSKPS